MGKVHGSLAKAGKVRGQTRKVPKQEKKKKPRGRAYKRLLFNRFSLKKDDACSTRPACTYEKERLKAELMLVGEYGLKNKRELYRINVALSKIRKAARVLLTYPEKDPRRIFQGNALLRRMVRYGFLDQDKQQLDYVLALTTDIFLSRRLQTMVFKMGLAKSIHHARVLIRQRHIRIRKQIVNSPSFIVRIDSQKLIDYAIGSSLCGGRPGRLRRKRATT